MKQLSSLLTLFLITICLTMLTGCGNKIGSNGSNKKEIDTNNQSQSSTEETAYDNVFPQHEPYGTGIGAMPGRVV